VRAGAGRRVSTVCGKVWNIVRRAAHRLTFDVDPLSTAWTALLLPGALRAKPISATERRIGHSPYVDPVLTATLFSVRLPLYPNLLLNMQSDFAAELVH
jgi:hypothetical protein